MVLRNKLKFGLVCAIMPLSCFAFLDNNTAIYNPPAQVMSHDDLNYFKYDCQHAAEQKVFLENQLKNISKFDLNNPDRAIIYMVLGQLRDNCPAQESMPVGCVHVREDMKSGSAQATVCNSDPQNGLRPLERPIINRWDPLVDLKSK